MMVICDVDDSPDLSDIDKNDEVYCDCCVVIYLISVIVK